MKKLVYLLVFVGLWGSVYAQKELAEGITLHTDRQVYIGGESIRFAAQVTAPQSDTLDWSRVLYLDLVGSDGEVYVQSKHPIHSGYVLGQVPLPAKLANGFYVLRAYTRFSRSQRQGAFVRLLLKVVNAQSTQSLAAPAQAPDSVWAVAPTEHAPRLALRAKQFAPRQWVDVQVDWSALASDASRLTTLAVVPRHSTFAYILPTDRGAAEPGLSPETRGLSIGGTVVDAQGTAPAPWARVNVSILGYNDMLTAQADSAGHFLVALPSLVGQHEVFVSAEQSADADLSLHLDLDYAADHPVDALPRFGLSAAEYQSCLAMATNVQVQAAWDSVAPAPSVPQPDTIPFYGAPTDVLYFDRYVPLPTVEEYFNELPFMAKVRQEGKRKYFRIFSYDPDMRLYPPLVLLDMVAIDRIEELLAVAPQKIHRVELVDAVYQKGDVRFGGIVSVFTRGHDFGEASLPASGLFLDFDFFAPAPIEAPLPDAQQPDARNTLYWQSARSGRPESIRFRTADTPGSYRVVLRCTLANGSEQVQVADFEVR